MINTCKQPTGEFSITYNIPFWYGNGYLRQVQEPSRYCKGCYFSGWSECGKWICWCGQNKTNKDCFKGLPR